MQSVHITTNVVSSNPAHGLSASLETICRMGIGFISALLYPRQNTRLSTSYKVRVSLQI
jgi:hypothetical protein